MQNSRVSYDCLSCFPRTRIKAWNIRTSAETWAAKLSIRVCRQHSNTLVGLFQHNLSTFNLLLLFLKIQGKLLFCVGDNAPAGTKLSGRKNHAVGRQNKSYFELWVPDCNFRSCFLFLHPSSHPLAYVRWYSFDSFVSNPIHWHYNWCRKKKSNILTKSIYQSVHICGYQPLDLNATKQRKKATREVNKVLLHSFVLIYSYEAAKKRVSTLNSKQNATFCRFLSFYLLYSFRQDKR